MKFLLTLPLCLLILLVDAVQAESIFSRSYHSVRRAAAQRTHILARDLRTAFGSVLVSQSPLDSTRTHAVYCKAGSGSLSGSGGGGSGTGGNNGTNAGGSSSTASGSQTATVSSAGASATSSPVSTPWKLVKEHSGESFFQDWDFWTFPDPTHGIVDYISESEARSAGLLSISDRGSAIMRVETTDKVSDLRKSIRIHTKDSYNFMLIIMDAAHMPTGCGTWPAFWTNGPNWPAGGEIDIVEGVSDYTHNQATIHTDPGCHISSSSSSDLRISGTVIGGTNCAAAETGNQGCGVRSESDVSFGKPFNENGGGVFAMQWDEDGIAVYFFDRDNIPSDIKAGTPAPSTWGNAQARWPSESCDMRKYFYDNIAIFDTTLCGDWAAGVWQSSGVPGQEESCAARTGYDTCEEYVRNNGAAFSEAYWDVNYVKIYQTD